MSFLSYPIPMYYARNGQPLENGMIYIGEAGQDAETNPIDAFWDEALTIPAAQPIRTVDGYPTYQGAAKRIWIAESSCSITVKDRNGRIVLSNEEGLPFATLKQLGSSAVGSGASLIMTTSGYTVQQLLDAEGRFVVQLQDGATYDAVKAAANKVAIDTVVAAMGVGDTLTCQRYSNPVSILALAKIQKMIRVDLGGNTFLWDSTYGDAAAYASAATDFNASPIRPLFWFAGSRTLYTQTAAITKGATSITVDAAAAAALQPGDAFYIRSDNQIAFWAPFYASGWHRPGETNIVKSISGTTVELMFATRYAYSTNVTLSVLQDRGAEIFNGRIEEQNCGARYGGSVDNNIAPVHILFERIIEPRARNIDIANVNISGIVETGCFNNIVKECRLYLAQRRGVGGHGNLFKSQGEYSQGTIVTLCESYSGRHLVDWSYCHGGRSTFNRGYGDESSYTWHGLGTVGCWSINDEAWLGSPSGWDVGRTMFASDYDVRIINPRGSGTRRTIHIYGKTIGCKIEGGEITAAGNAATGNAYCVLITDVPEGIGISGTTFIQGNSFVENCCIEVRRYFGTSGTDPYTWQGLITPDAPSIIKIRECEFNPNDGYIGIVIRQMNSRLVVHSNELVCTGTSTAHRLVEVQASNNNITDFDCLKNFDRQISTGRATMFTIGSALLPLAGMRVANISEKTIGTAWPTSPATVDIAPHVAIPEWVATSSLGTVSSVPAGGNSDVIGRNNSYGEILTARADNSMYDVTFYKSGEGGVATYRVWFAPSGTTQVWLLNSNGAPDGVVTTSGGDVVINNTSVGSKNYTVTAVRWR